MEFMTHNKVGIWSSINGAGKSGETQEIQGAIIDFKILELEIPIKTGVTIRSMRQVKKKKFLDDRNATLYAKWWKKLMFQ